MINTISANAQLDELLEEICSTLQLTVTQYEEATSRYTAVGTWLSKPGSPLFLFKPDIYPQGSVRLQTTVKPRNREEYDVDLVCLLQLDPSFYRNPMLVYNIVEDRLRDNDLYNDKVERFKRCLRINYANEFHLDITPACPDPTRGEYCILVPDRKLEAWKPSNPIGYAEWFESRAMQCSTLFLTKRIEPFPEPESVSGKPPLRRVVQLMKRHRDVVFGDDDNAPRSIALTTLAGHHYNGQQFLSDSLLSVLEAIAARIEATPGPISIPNPANPPEKFCEAWTNNPEAYQAFVDFIFTFRSQLRSLLGKTGLHNIAQVLNDLFGEAIIRKAMKSYTDRLSKARRQGILHFGRSSAGLTISGRRTKPVPENRFYGR